jgi:hypothetical protein
VLAVWAPESPGIIPSASAQTSLKRLITPALITAKQGTQSGQLTDL